LARYTTAVLSGVGAGVAFGLTIRADILNSIGVVISDAGNLRPDPFSAVVSVLAMVTVLVYFMYSAKYSTVFHAGRFRIVARIGRYFLYTGLGFQFGIVYMNMGLGELSSFLVVYLYRTFESLRVVVGF
jgi:hypothetical protein